MRLRKYRSEDWEEVMELFRGTVHSVNSADYTEPQLDAWAPKDMDLPGLKNRLLNTYAVVAEKDGVIVGFGNADVAGYFDCIYTHKDYQGMGIATLIADDIEKYLVRNGVQIVTTDASITAKPFFEKRGYTADKEQSVECRGQYFTNFKMRKVLRGF